MDLLFKFILICLLPAIVAPVMWLFLRIVTQSTKYAWALAIAVGYATGHLSLVSWGLVPDGEWTVQIGEWAKHLPVALQAIVWPETALNWLPIGVLLAGLVSANAAAFPMPGVTFVGAAAISAWLTIQLVGGMGILNSEALTASVGIRLAVGAITLMACWLSVQRSIQGRPRWIWIGVVFIMTIAVATILGVSGNSTYSTLGAVVISAMLGSLLVSLPNSGTDNVRFAGSTIAVASISLLLIGWIFSTLPWYPIPLVAIGFFAINMRLPEFAQGITGRMSVSFLCAVTAVCVTVFVP